MKKKNLNGLSLNKKSISNLAQFGGNDEQPAPTQYHGCNDSNACESGRCITGIQCEIDSYLCSIYQCGPLPTTVFPIC